jgi:ankyrin repeat protein
MNVRSSDVVRLLVSRGADVNARSKRGETALADAAGRGDVDGVKLLLEKGADVNVADYRGYTPLIQAVAVRPRLSGDREAAARSRRQRYGSR